VAELAVTRNTTEAMNLVAQGVELKAGDEVLTTDHEHAGGSLCWRYYAQRGVVVKQVALPLPEGDPDEIVTRFAAAITPATRVISVSHVTYTTGMRLPIARLAELAHTHQALLVVDGAQAPGGLVVDLHALQCDAYATSAHKWLLAPKGTGLLFIRESAQARIRPIMLQSGMGVYTGATGARGLPEVIGLGRSLRFLTELGWPAVEAHTLALRAQFVAAVRQSPYPLLSPAAAERGAPIVTLGLPERTSPDTLCQALLAKHQIAVRPMVAGGVRGIRVSLHVFNQAADGERLLRALTAEVPG
jgi:selenocysteine lyase/cysteine desulfurase